MNDRAIGSPHRSASTYALVALLLFQGVSGIGGGAALVAAPDGSVLQMPISALAGSPFENFLIPGLTLLIVLGVVPVVVAIGLLQRHEWAWRVSALIGASLIVFIIVEIAVIGYSSEPPLQLIYGLTGVAILLVSLTRFARA